MPDRLIYLFHNYTILNNIIYIIVLQCKIIYLIERA